jgi:hypothetical protein
MPKSASRRGRLFTVESIAGWIFADLLLVLFLVGLGSAKAYTPPEPPPPPPPAPKQVPIVGMKTDPVLVQVRVNGRRLGEGTALSKPERDVVCREVRNKLARVRGERAALVLIFGGASDVTTGQNIARAVGRELNCADPKVFRGRVPTRAFWDGTLPLGSARLEVFLFVIGKAPR